MTVSGGRLSRHHRAKNTLVGAWEVPNIGTVSTSLTSVKGIGYRILRVESY